MVLSAARDEFRSHGYAATSVDSLAAATGLNRSSLYGSFGDKHRLFLRALDGYCEATLHDVREVLRERGVSARQRLINHVHAIVNGIVADTDRRGCMMSRSSAELAGADPDVSGIVERSLEAWRRELADCIAEAQLEGAVAGDGSPQALATVMLSLMQGFEALGKGGVGSAELRAAESAALALLFGAGTDPKP